MYLLKKQAAHMGKQSWKRLLLIGFIVVLLIAIPLTLYVLKQRSDTQSHAQASTKTKLYGGW